MLSFTFVTLKTDVEATTWKNNSANINGVISLSSPAGLRTIHLLRSILFRALPSHAIRADLKRYVRRNLNTKSETSCDPGEHN